LAIAGIAIAYYYRRGKGYAFNESLSFSMENENMITLERRNGNGIIVSKENLEEL